MDDFLITGAKVHVHLTDLGGKEMTLALPEIHLTDLGKGSDGLTPGDLTRAMLKAVSAATIKVVSRQRHRPGQKFGRGQNQEGPRRVVAKINSSPSEFPPRLQFWIASAAVRFYTRSTTREFPPM
ncbi:MAG: hypothetical protein WDN00_07475 [Limisphaerales bacterium]